MQRQSSSIDRESPSRSSDVFSDIASPLRKEVEMKIYARAKTDEELFSSKSEVMSLEMSQLSETFSSADDNIKSPDSLESKDLLEEPRSPDPSTDPLEGTSGYREPENLEATPSTSESESLPKKLKTENENNLLPFLADLRTENLTTKDATLLLKFPYSMPRFETEIESIGRMWEEFYIPKSDGFDENYVTGEPKRSSKKWKSIRNILTSPSKLFKRRETSSPRKRRTEIEEESVTEPTEPSLRHCAEEENPREDMKITRYLCHLNTEIRQILQSLSEAAERITRSVFLSSPETYLPQIVKFLTEYQMMEQEFMKLRIQCSDLLIEVRAEQFCRMRKKMSSGRSEEEQEVTVPFLADKLKLARTFLLQIIKFLTLFQNLSEELSGSKSLTSSVK